MIAAGTLAASTARELAVASALAPLSSIDTSCCKSLTSLFVAATAGPAGRTEPALDCRLCVLPSPGIPLPDARQTAHGTFRRTVLANVRTVRTLYLRRQGVWRQDCPCTVRW